MNTKSYYAEKLKKARSDAGLTQNLLATITGIPRVMIAQYETARQYPFVHKYDALMDACRKIAGRQPGQNRRKK